MVDVNHMRYHVTDVEIHHRQKVHDEKERLIDIIISDIRLMAKKGLLGDMTPEELEQLIKEEHADLELMGFAELTQTAKEVHSS